MEMMEHRKQQGGAYSSEMQVGHDEVSNASNGEQLDTVVKFLTTFSNFTRFLKNIWMNVYDV